MSPPMRPALALVLLLAAAPALAQDKAAPKPSKEAPRKKKVLRLEAITVEGHVQKPQAIYILPRSNPSFDELNKAESFAPKVVKSVEQEPF